MLDALKSKGCQLQSIYVYQFKLSEKRKSRMLVYLDGPCWSMPAIINVLPWLLIVSVSDCSSVEGGAQSWSTATLHSSSIIVHTDTDTPVYLGRAGTSQHPDTISWSPGGGWLHLRPFSWQRTLQSVFCISDLHLPLCLDGNGLYAPLSLGVWSSDHLDIVLGLAFLQQLRLILSL